MYKALVIPHVLYSMVAIGNPGRITTIRQLLKIALLNFKKFVGLKKTTPNNVILQSLGMNLPQMEEQLFQDTNIRWKTKLGNDFEHVEVQAIRFPQLREKINWKYLELINLFYANCRVQSSQLLNIANPKDHKLSRQEMKFLGIDSLLSNK